MIPPDTERWIRSWLGHKLGYLETLKTTYRTCVALIEDGVPGDFAEFGVYAGAECAMMARAIMDTGTQGRMVHLFDSFEGMPACGPEDSEFITAGNQPGEASCPINDVMANMLAHKVPERMLYYHQGWFAETIPTWLNLPGSKQLAMVRVDCDLYESTKDVLKPVYPLLARGGWLIVDDYPLSGCRKALHEVVGYLQPAYFQKLP